MTTTVWSTIIVNENPVGGWETMTVVENSPAETDWETVIVQEKPVGQWQSVTVTETAPPPVDVFDGPLYHAHGETFVEGSLPTGVTRTGGTVNINAVGESTLTYEKDGLVIERKVIVPFKISDLKKVYRASELADSISDFSIEVVNNDVVPNVSSSNGLNFTTSVDSDMIRVTISEEFLLAP